MPARMSQFVIPAVTIVFVVGALVATGYSSLTGWLTILCVFIVASFLQGFLFLNADWPTQPDHEASKMKRDLIGRSQLLVNLATDIRTPMNAILDQCELIMVSDLTYAQRKNLAKLRTEAESLSDLLDNLLDVAAVEVGRLQLRPIDFSVRESLAQVLGPYKFHAHQNDRLVNHFVQTRVPDSLFGDVERLKNVISTLMDYALSSTEGKEIIVRVSVKERDEQHITLLYSIAAQTGEDAFRTIEYTLAQIREQQGVVEQRSASDLQLVVAARMIQLLKGELSIIRQPGQPQQLQFTTRFGISQAKTPVGKSERTMLGLIPDLPVLVVAPAGDDQAMLEDMLIRWQTEPYCVETADEMWRELDKGRTSGTAYNLLIIDADLRDLSGFELSGDVKAHQIYSSLPTILLIDPNHPEHQRRVGRMPGATTLIKPVKSSLLAKAITSAVLGQGRFKEMRKGLGAAELYVRSLIPAPVKEPIAIDWRYVPAADLGGDALGFHWIDDEHCAIYILDVCGHGLDASMLSVSVLNVLKSMSLPQTDFTQPDKVLAELNRKFPMEAHGDRCFTAWYAIYNRARSELTWAGGGHPAALFFPIDSDDTRVLELESTGSLIGMMPDSTFEPKTRTVRAGDRLYVYTDGVFEIETAESEFASYEDFVEFTRQGVEQDRPVLDGLWERARTLSDRDILDDDFTVLEVRF